MNSNYANTHKIIYINSAVGNDDSLLHEDGGVNHHFQAHTDENVPAHFHLCSKKLKNTHISQDYH